MTITATERKDGPYSCNGVLVDFDFNFKVFTDEDITVLWTPQGGSDTTLVKTAEYTVTLNADQDSTPGGTITTVDTYATGDTITIIGSLAYEQTTELTNRGGFFPKVVEKALDRIVILIQQLKEQVDRAVTVPASVGGIGGVSSGFLPAPEAYALLGWDAAGENLVNYVNDSPASLIEARRCPQNAQNGNYTLILTDAGHHIYSENVGAQTITLPLNASVAFDTGAIITIVNDGTTAITIDDGGTTLKLAGTVGTGNRTLAVGGMATLLHVKDDTWFLTGAGIT